MYALPKVSTASWGALGRTEEITRIDITTWNFEQFLRSKSSVVNSLLALHSTPEELQPFADCIRFGDVQSVKKFVEKKGQAAFRAEFSVILRSEEYNAEKRLSLSPIHLVSNRIKASVSVFD